MSLTDQLFAAPQDEIHNFYKRFRESDQGVHVDAERNMAFVMRYAEADSALRRKDIFSNDTFWQSPASIHDPADLVHVRYVNTLQHFLLLLDPPKHTRLRGLVRQAFTPDAIRRMRTTTASAADQLLGQFETGQEIEFVSEIAEQLPIWVIASMIGVPPSDHADFRRWTLAIIDTLEPSTDMDGRDRAIHTATELIEYLGQHIEKRRADSSASEDLLQSLLDAEEDGNKLTSEELVCMLMVLLTAGNTTTTDLLANALVLFAAHPDQKRELLAHPELMGQAIDEIVRLEPSLRWVMRRTVGESVELGGKTIPRETLIWISVASANRDERRFADPNTFDIRRENNRHLGFGSGIHYCIGAPLARLEAEVMLTKFLDLFPDATPLSLGPGLYKDEFISRSVAELEVRLA